MNPLVRSHQNLTRFTQNVLCCFLVQCDLLVDQTIEGLFLNRSFKVFAGAEIQSLCGIEQLQ